jgi:ADP-heptose:LPS heptosyltransferase
MEKKTKPVIHEASPLIVHTNCRYYEGSKPCDFHKKDGRLCDGCADYDPVTSRVLIVKLAAVGDVLRTTSILPALRRKYAGSEITWVTKASAAPLLKRNPLIDRVLVIEENYLEFIRNEKFSVGICLDADPLSATVLSLAACTERFGFVADIDGRVQPVNERAKAWWYMGLNDERKKQNRKTYQQIMYEICDLPLPTEKPQLFIDEQSTQYGRAFLDRKGLTKTKKLLGLNTGGGGRWQHKKWTFEGYLGFIKLLRERHPEIGIVLLGGPEEVELNRRIMETMGDHIVDAGCNNSLTQFSSLINSLDVLLTSDSLAMHIGVALGKSTVVLVGPTSPWELDVYGNGEIVHSDIDCLVCYLSRCDKVVTCMNTLSPETVLGSVERYLQ